MSSFPRSDEILTTYEDPIEALERLLHGRAVAAADPRSRFYQRSNDWIQERLRQDREELDRWALMMLVASFEAMMRSDAE